MTGPEAERPADEPELRDGPPWVMEEMIDAEVELPALIAGEEAVALVARRVAEAVRGRDPITVCGCGTSEHAAQAIAAIVNDMIPAAGAVARDAFEVALAPPRHGLLIAVSHEAGTAATLDAARGAISRGARAVLITACPDEARGAVEVAATPLRDRSWCHTVGYSSPLLVAGLGAGLPAEVARRLITGAIDGRPQRRADAAALAGCERLLIIGSGIDEITARELALKIEEAAHLPCTPLGTEKVLHGHLPAADGQTGAVLLRFDPAQATGRDRRTATVADALAVLEMQVVTLGATGLASGAQALLAGAIALQLLALELSMARGTNPDLIRREQPLYRRVAVVGDTGTWDLGR
jgi:fructoselysine-6-P-deglycase FrlB-like protein